MALREVRVDASLQGIGLCSCFRFYQAQGGGESYLYIESAKVMMCWVLDKVLLALLGELEIAVVG